jgi:hypothetical protein
MITDQQAEAANDFIRDNADKYAQAKANRIYLDEFRKTQKAILFQQAKTGTIQDKESYAYAHPEYVTVLDGLRAAVEDEERIKWQMTAAQAKIEIWRTQQANNRRGV